MDKINSTKSRLADAIEKTFKNRNTDIKNADVIFNSEFINNKDKQVQWEAFLRKNKLSAPSFIEVLDRIKSIIYPIIKNN